MNEPILQHEAMPVAFRPAVASDMAYIVKTWSVDFHKNYPTVSVPNQIYFPHQAKIINNIVNKCGAVICCIDDEPDTIVGYIVFERLSNEDTLIHWAQVKGIFRRMRILTSMLTAVNADKNLFVSHHFKLFNELKNKYRFIYDPTTLDEYTK